MADTSHRYANVTSTAAAITALAAFLRSGQAVAAGNLPPELMELIVAMAGDLNKIVEFIGTFSPEQQLIIEAVVPSYRTVNNVRVDLPGPGGSVRFPPMVVPAGIQIKIKAGWNNAGIVYIANSGPAAQNPYAAETLVRNEFTTYYVKNAEDLYGASTNAGDYVILTVEGN